MFNGIYQSQSKYCFHLQQSRYFVFQLIDIIFLTLQLFIPMHDDCPGHWYLCIIDLKNSHIQILNSLRLKSRDEFRFKSVKTVVCFHIFVFLLIFFSFPYLLTTFKINQVEFCQAFFKLYDIGKYVFQFSIAWAPSIPTQDNGLVSIHNLH